MRVVLCSHLLHVKLSSALRFTFGSWIWLSFSFFSPLPPASGASTALPSVSSSSPLLSARVIARKTGSRVARSRTPRSCHCTAPCLPRVARGASPPPRARGGTPPRVHA
eukprot:CAMPEP_0203012022 /NCGR_PEP_ID=MMETSP1401-20130829/13193_1 /ASSEMBLY_ACC=CAM_ASM_000894 /TAXON_ID=38833 /ORGANISM="Micromonas pusilla, Strain CCAC1681" /LENGTH=108 /DNA_ID=CAMNT_0049753715 /DNA_START=59 /DNA_END=381 /DNA_ORIENTATION=+